MKDKIMIFIIGVLIGAVIATGAFYIYSNNNDSGCSSNNMQMNMGQPPEMGNGTQPPAMPNNNNTDNSN